MHPCVPEVAIDDNVQSGHMAKMALLTEVQAGWQRSRRVMFHIHDRAVGVPPS